MSTRTIVALMFLLLVPSIGVAQDEGRGVELVLTSQRLIEAEPGKIVTASYLITNRTGREQDLYEKLGLPVVPDGWKPLAAFERPIFLGIDAQKVQLVTFIIPKDCPAGRYDVLYSLIDRRFNGIKSEETFTVVVSPVVKIDAVVEDKPDMVMAGDSYRVRMRLVNKGNNATTVRVEATGSPAYPITLDPIEATLEAGKSQLVQLSVLTDGKLRSKTNHVVEISAVTEAPDNTFVTEKRTVFVEILPRLVAAIDPRSRVPSRVSFIAVGENDDGGMQIEYSGAGNLDEGGTRTVDFTFRGPDVQERSVYGVRDELRLNYRGPLLEMLLGDQAYSLSPLSERLLYGRGGEMRLHPGGIELGSFYTETRWDIPGKKEAGAFAGYSYGSAFRLKANYLNKRRDVSSSFDAYEADIYSVQARIAPYASFNLGLEYGYCMNKDADVRDDQAHRVTLDGQIRDRVWYTFENTYAAPHFLGYYNDVLYGSGTVSASLYRNLRGNISYRIYENNLDLNAEKPAAAREESYRGVLSYAFSSGLNLSLDYETLARRDDLTPSQFDFDENIWRIGVGRSLNKVGLQVYSERALFQDHLTGDPARSLYNHSFYANFNLSPRQSYSLIARYGYNSFLGNPERTGSIGFSASFRPVAALRATISYQTSNLGAERLPRSEYLMSILDFTLPNRHAISVKGRWFRFEEAGKSDYSFFAAYTIPFDIPAMKKKSFGALNGCVMDRDRRGAPPMENVLVSVGTMATMTDYTGTFNFPSLKPGTYAVQVDQRSMGMNRITSDPAPFEVEVIGGETAFQEIGVSTAAAISGTVLLYAVDAESGHGVGRPGGSGELYVTAGGEAKQGSIEKEDLVVSGGLEDIVVEVSNGKETFRQATDQDGRFSFPGLRPGVWHCTVYKNGLPKHHYIEQENLTVELSSGEETELQVNVLPKLRSIHMLESGTVGGEKK
jgi:hypothetical protein